MLKNSPLKRLGIRYGLESDTACNQFLISSTQIIWDRFETGYGYHCYYCQKQQQDAPLKDQKKATQTN